MIKRVQAVLRHAMDEALGPLGISVPKFACLRALDRRPDASNAELARAAFVSRQSMNVVLRTLQDRGLVHRPAKATKGRALPTQLTPEGRRILDEAAELVLDVEARMLAPLSTTQRDRLCRDLEACAIALGVPASW